MSLENDMSTGWASIEGLWDPVRTLTTCMLTSFNIEFDATLTYSQLKSNIMCRIFSLEIQVLFINCQVCELTVRIMNSFSGA